MNKHSSSIYCFITASLLLVLPIIITAIFSVDSIVNTSLKKIVFVLFGISFYTLLISFLRPKHFLLVLTPVAVLVMVELYIVYTLKSGINEGILASIFNTNYEELTGVLFSNILYVILSIIFLALYVYLMVKVKNNLLLPKKVRIFFLLFFMAVQTSIIARDVVVSVRLSVNESIKEMVIYSYNVKIRKTFPVSWFVHFKNFKKKDNHLRTYKARIESFVFGAVESEPIPDRKVVVWVIGESARRHNFSLYGYQRRTNPLLEQEENLIALKNATSLYNLTSYAFPGIITRATSKNFETHLNEPSIMKAFEEAGFNTVYINNQPLGHGSIYHTYAIQSNALIDLSTSLDFKSTDEVILPVFRNIFEQTNHQKVFVMVHSIGSHFRYNLRYPEDFDVFKPSINNQFDLLSINRKRKDELVNSYDNSILFTDYFLSGIISIMKEDSVTASVMMYMSDHGENLFDDDQTGFGHGSSIITSYEKEIPSFLFTSEQYRIRYPHKVKNIISNVDASINTDHFFHSVLDLGGVYIDEETTKKSFASEMFEN